MSNYVKAGRPDTDNRQLPASHADTEHFTFYI